MEVKYDEFAFGEALDKKAAELFSDRKGLVANGVRSYRVDGRCPRCEHRMTESGALDVIFASVPDRSRSPQPSPAATAMEIPLRCSCSFKHEEAPGSVTGCGAEFIVTIPPEQIEVLT